MSTLVAILKFLANLFGFGSDAIHVAEVGGAAIAGAEIQAKRDEDATLKDMETAHAIDESVARLSDDELDARLRARAGR